MFLNSSIGISEGVRATLFLRDCRKRNIIHRGGVDIKWNGPRYLQIIRWQFGADSSIILEFIALRVKSRGDGPFVL